MRICLSGAQGLGKSTLADTLSTTLKIKRLVCDTVNFMPCGVKNHLDMIKLAATDSEKAIDFYNRLIDYKYGLFKSNSSFIHERTLIDSYIYYMYNVSMFDTSSNQLRIKEMVIDSLQYIDINTVIVSEPSLFSNTDNNIRINNTDYVNLIKMSIASTTGDLYELISKNKLIYKTLSIYDGEACVSYSNINHKYLVYFNEKVLYNATDRALIIEDLIYKIICDEVDCAKTLIH